MTMLRTIELINNVLREVAEKDGSSAMDCQTTADPVKLSIGVGDDRETMGLSEAFVAVVEVVKDVLGTERALIFRDEYNRADRAAFIRGGK